MRGSNRRVQRRTVWRSDPALPPGGGASEGAVHVLPHTPWGASYGVERGGRLQGWSKINCTPIGPSEELSSVRSWWSTSNVSNHAAAEQALVFPAGRGHRRRSLCVHQSMLQGAMHVMCCPWWKTRLQSWGLCRSRY